VSRCLLSEIFYRECAGCNSFVDMGSYLCDSCLKTLPYVKNSCPSCGYPLEVETAYCMNCFNENKYDFLYIPFWYTGVIKKLLKEIKFRYGVRGIYFLKELISTLNYDFSGYDVVVSVPSHMIRKLRRFRHPADIISDVLADKNKIPKKGILVRHKYTKYQWQLKKKSRKINVKNAIGIKSDVSKLNILLVDDILTTGNTINECARVLKKGGASNVDCFVLSKGVFI